MVETRLRARSSVLRRSESGKLPSCWMSLSVKSIASCGYGKTGQLSFALEKSDFFFVAGAAYTRNTQVFNCWYFMA